MKWCGSTAFWVIRYRKHGKFGPKAWSARGADLTGDRIVKLLECGVVKVEAIGPVTGPSRVPLKLKVHYAR